VAIALDHSMSFSSSFVPSIRGSAARHSSTGAVSNGAATVRISVVGVTGAALSLICEAFRRATVQ